jgi:hypothetical protein
VIATGVVVPGPNDSDCVSELHSADPQDVGAGEFSGTPREGQPLDSLTLVGRLTLLTFRFGIAHIWPKLVWRLVVTGGEL